MLMETRCARWIEFLACESMSCPHVCRTNYKFYSTIEIWKDAQSNHHEFDPHMISLFIKACTELFTMAEMQRATCPIFWHAR